MQFEGRGCRISTRKHSTKRSTTKPRRWSNVYIVVGRTVTMSRRSFVCQNEIQLQFAATQTSVTHICVTQRFRAQNLLDQFFFTSARVIFSWDVVHLYTSFHCKLYTVKLNALYGRYAPFPCDCTREDSELFAGVFKLRIPGKLCIGSQQLITMITCRTRISFP